MGRFALRDDRTMFLFVFRAEHGSEGLTPKEQLHNQFSDAGWECPRILAALDHVDDLYFDVVSQIRMDHWSRGRVLLIGDAAGCISLLGGEGTGLAITEAYVLAGELMRTDGDHQRLQRLRDPAAPVHPIQAIQCGEIHFVFRHADAIRALVPQRGDAHDELRPAGHPCQPRRARQLRAARLRDIATTLRRAT